MKKYPIINRILALALASALAASSPVSVFADDNTATVEAAAEEGTEASSETAAEAETTESTAVVDETTTETESEAKSDDQSTESETKADGAAESDAVIPDEKTPTSGDAAKADETTEKTEKADKDAKAECTHVDEDKDGICDLCKETMPETDEKSTECKEHVDENKDCVCDVCGEKIECVDEDGDGLCDVCGKEVEKKKTENKELNFEYKDGEDAVVTLTGTIPENLTPSVKLVDSDNEDYKKLEEETKENAKEGGYSYYGFKVYDISFTDEDGNSVHELGADVKVSIKYTDSYIEKITNAISENDSSEETVNVTANVLHLENSGEIEKLDVTTEKNDAQNVEKVSFSNDSFSSYATSLASNVVTEGLEISENELTNTGCLTAATKSSFTPIEGKTLKYRWFKKVGTGDYDEVKQTQYQSDALSDKDKYNTKTGENWVNIVLDKGVPSDAESEHAVTYYVEGYYDDDTEKTAVVKSADYSVKYYNQLQNGSFEYPDFSKDDNNGFMHQIYSQSDDYKDDKNLAWQATTFGYHGATEVDIEILSASSLSKRQEGAKNYAFKSADAVAAAGTQGTQFAEINCEVEAALYQDVMTVKGQEMHYSFYHRARGVKPNEKEYDTMYLVIMPSDVASTKGDDGGAIDTQAELEKVYKNLQVDLTKGYYFNSGDYAGTYIRKVTSDDQSWHKYADTDDDITKYTATSYSTRFFFVAGSQDEVASKNVAVGNFIDDVWFSQNLPDVEQNKVRLTLSKTITGLYNGEAKYVAENLKFNVKAYSDEACTNEVQNAPLAGEISGSKLEWTWTQSSTGDEGTYTGTYTLEADAVEGTKYYYKVVEDETTAGYSDFSRETSTSIKLDSDTGSTADYVCAGGGDTIKCDITNKYSVPATEDKAATNRKYITKNDDGSYNLTLNFTSPYKTEYIKGSTTNKQNLEIVLVVDKSGSMKGEKKDKTINAINTLANSIGELETAGTVSAKWNVVTFANSASGASGWFDTNYRNEGQTQTNDVGNKVSTSMGNPDGGTNYQDGLYKASKIDESGLTDAKRVVIFVTDGEPTIHNSKTEITNVWLKCDHKKKCGCQYDYTKREKGYYKYETTNVVANDGGSKDGGGSYETENDYKGAIMGAGAITADYFYVVGIDVSSDESRNYKSGTDTLSDVAKAANATTSKVYNASADELSDVFSSIAGSIISTRSKVEYEASNAVITDTLSKYAEVVPGSSFTISVKDKDGKEVSSTSTPGNVGGTDSSSNSDATYNIGGATLTGAYNSESKTFTLTMGTDQSPYTLNHEYTYSITFNIQPSEDAYNYVESGKAFENVGQKDTDAPGVAEENKISEGKYGLYSNKDGANVTYTFEKTQKTLNYYKPVITCQSRVHSYFQIRKTTTGSTGTDTYGLNGAKFKLVASDNTTYYGKSSTADDKDGLVTWYSDKDCSEELSNNIVPDGTYTLTEVEAPEGYQLSQETWTVEINSTQTTDAIKVTRTKDKDGASIQEQITVVPTTSQDGKTKYYTFDYSDTICYTLPETGGRGIYLYTISGMLLLIASSLLLYNARKRNNII